MLDITLPPSLAGGHYLLRTELLALQNAQNGDPQFYVGCAQLTVSSSLAASTGTGTGSNAARAVRTIGNIAKKKRQLQSQDTHADANVTTVAIPGHVSMDTPGLTFNIYDTPMKLPYPLFGPPVSGGASAGPATGIGSGSAVTTTVVSIEGKAGDNGRSSPLSTNTSNSALGAGGSHPGSDAAIDRDGNSYDGGTRADADMYSPSAVPLPTTNTTHGNVGTITGSTNSTNTTGSASLPLPTSSATASDRGVDEDNDEFDDADELGFESVDDCREAAATCWTGNLARRGRRYRPDTRAQGSSDIDEQGCDGSNKRCDGIEEVCKSMNVGGAD